MFGETLHSIIHVDRTMTIQDIADAWGLESKSVYYYMDSWPGLDKMLQLLRVAPRPAQHKLLQLVIRYAPGWSVSHAGHLDLNGDGDIHIDDLLAAAVHDIAETSATLTATHEALADGQLCQAEADELAKVAQRSLEATARYQAILVYLAQHKLITRKAPRPRKQAKPLPSVEGGVN